jgi:lipopolysaccharide export system protein LptA
VSVRFTIERLRTLVLVAGVLLVVALGVFLAVGRLRGSLNRRDIPKRLGIDIQQEANGVTYTQAHGGHTLFKIHASRVVELKNDQARLHDVEIELYGAEGGRVDRIQGDEFEYNEKDGTATAAGPVEMTLMRPSETAQPAHAGAQPPGKTAKSGAAAQGAQAGHEIHVKTSGITLDQKSGVVTTAARVDFSTDQGSGSAMGAMYDFNQGFLVLDHAVELTTQRGPGGTPVEIHADHAVFERDANVCNLKMASADYRGGRTTAGLAQILFRDDGTAVRMEVTQGFALATASGSHLAAPTGAMDFDEHNQPRDGRLEGGVTMDSVNGSRTVQGASPTMELEFTPQGALRHAHLERGVEMHSEETGEALEAGQSVPARVSRTWRSPVADIEFRPEKGRAGQGRVEPATIHGFGGVLVTGMSQRGSAAPSRSKLTADEVDGAFAPGSVLTHMSGVGHASLEEIAATGTRETSNGDRVEAQFTPATGGGAPGANAVQVESASLTGHVELMETPAPGARYTAPIHAWAGKAVYEDTGERLHLTMGPRIESGQAQLSADKIDISRESGQAFAHGNVKATYFNAGGPGGTGAAGEGDAGESALGGRGPTHVVAAEGEMNQSTGSATFRGDARLWQLANSISAPEIVLDHQRQMLTAQTTSAARPVTAVLLLAGSAMNPAETRPGEGSAKAKASTPAVIRVRGGEFSYWDAEHRAEMRGGVLGKVTAETDTARSTSSQVELLLMPGGPPQANGASSQAQVDRMTASGDVVLTSQGRKGSGDQLLYSGTTGDYVLTGSAAAPPRMSDPERGTVTGAALIFHSRDDSVSIEGGAQETETETKAPR